MEFDIDIAEYIVEEGLKSGANYIEVRLEHNISRSLIVKNGNVESLLTTQTEGLGVRVLASGGMSFFSLNHGSKSTLKSEIEKAVSIAKNIGLKTSSSTRLSEEEVYEDKYSAGEVKPLANVDVSDMLSLLLDVDKVTRECKVKVPSRYVYLKLDMQSKYILTSEGGRILSQVPRALFFMAFTAVHNGKILQDMEEIGGSGGWELIEKEDPVTLASNMVASLSKSLIEGEKSPTGVMDVVLGGDVVGLAVHESVGHPYEADRILGREAAQAGESFISKEMIGFKIGSDMDTVIDDPTIKGSYGYYLYDDEGVKARPRYLIKNGVINEFLHNRETAATFGVKSNASARASNYDREPIIRMANTYMAPGDMSLEELIEQVSFGIYMKKFMEWNIDDRRYNMRFVGSEAYLIKSGKLEGPIIKPILEITTPAFHKSIAGVGKNLIFKAATCGKSDPAQGVPVWTGGPDILLREVHING